jgi:molybdopterin synthase sulfur carrier subunit
MATIKIPPVLRASTGGEREVSADGDNVGAVLNALAESHPETRGQLFSDDGGLNRYVNVYLNDEDVRFLGALDAKLSDGDSITILPAVAGGALGFAAAAALLGR